MSTREEMLDDAARDAAEERMAERSRRWREASTPEDPHVIDDDETDPKPSDED